MAYRGQVLWCGSSPTAEIEKAFDDRGLTVRALDVSEVERAAPNARGIVFDLDGVGDKLLSRANGGVLALALAHGLVPIVLGPMNEAAAIRRKLDTLRYGRRVRLGNRNHQEPIAETCARHEPMQPLSTRLVLSGHEKLDKEDQILVRRAFGDCTEVRLERLNGGKSAEVFQAFANLENSRVGRFPLPFFVKLDRFTKIKIELANYRDCTALFVPFHARPNIDGNRCFLGAERGVIVGNFVEHSESLGDIVARGTAQAAINSLFDDALRGWRSQAYGPAAMIRDEPLARGLRGAIPSTFNQKQVDRANEYALEARKHGAQLSASDIAKMFDTLPAAKYRGALSHGDLHGENVRVRSGHAILIDFAAVKDLPLVADPAALETAICLRAAASEDEWKAFVSELYKIENLRALPAPAEPGAPMAAYWNSVRQIRRFGLAEQMSASEYATAVGISLLRHGLRKRDEDEQDLRRPFLIALSERLARSIADG